MAKTVQEGTVEFTVREMGGDLGAVFDMLRYDGAQVLGWTKGETTPRGTRWSLRLRSERPFTQDRWSSFGLRVSDVESHRI
jgi:hypothetical protein